MSVYTSTGGLTPNTPRQFWSWLGVDIRCHGYGYTRGSTTGRVEF